MKEIRVFLRPARFCNRCPALWIDRKQKKARYERYVRVNREHERS